MPSRLITPTHLGSAPHGAGPRPTYTRTWHTPGLHADGAATRFRLVRSYGIDGSRGQRDQRFPVSDHPVDLSPDQIRYFMIATWSHPG
jgi:hypothetical protein